MRGAREHARACSLYNTLFNCACVFCVRRPAANDIHLPIHITCGGVGSTTTILLQTVFQLLLLSSAASRNRASSAAANTTAGPGGQNDAQECVHTPPPSPSPSSPPPSIAAQPPHQYPAAAMASQSLTKCVVSLSGDIPQRHAHAEQHNEQPERS